MIKKYASLFIGLAVVIGFALTAYAETTSSVVLSRTLSVGSTGNEVVMLQNFLKDKACFTYGTATGYFGQLTKTAVMNFQSVNGIASIGIVGPLTRAKIASGVSLSCKTSEIQTPTPATSNTPVASLLPLPLPLPAGGILGGGSTGDHTAPTAPAELSKSNVSTTSMTLSWTESTDDRSGVTGYSLERCAGASCTDFAEITSGNVLTYDDSGLNAATTYRYRVRAVDGAGNYSDYSSVLGVTTMPFWYTLTVTKSGTGVGLVTSSPVGISCGATCLTSYPGGAMITLTAVSNMGSTFTGWSGDCIGTGVCVVTVDQARTVGAIFTVIPYSVGGTVSGYASSGLVLQNNGGDNFTVSGNGSFSFSTLIDPGASYDVTVLSQPDGQTCGVTNGSGTMGYANVTNITITCSTNSYTVGGTISYLADTLVLQNNGGDNYSAVTDGPFTFATPVAEGAPYSVTVLTQPFGQTCTVTNGAGTMGSSNITNVSISCIVDNASA